MIILTFYFKLYHPKIIFKNLFKLTSFLIIIVALIGINQSIPKNRKLNPYTPLVAHLPQLAMSGDDPYIRALMSTISASK
jgi:hypothetical protein